MILECQLTVKDIFPIHLYEEVYFRVEGRWAIPVNALSEISLPGHGHALA